MPVMDTLTYIRALGVEIVEVECLCGRCATYDRYGRIAYLCARLDECRRESALDALLAKIT